jgi:glycosyltransferase involved in cell wall biosynthesis
MQNVLSNGSPFLDDIHVIFEKDAICGITYYSRKLIKAFENIGVNHSIHSKRKIIQYDPGIFPNTRKFYGLYKSLEGDKLVTYHSIRENSTRIHGINFVDHPIFHTKSSHKLYNKGFIVPHGCEIFPKVKDSIPDSIFMFGFDIQYKNFSFLDKIKNKFPNIKIKIKPSKPSRNGLGFEIPEKELNEMIQESWMVVLPYHKDFYGASGAVRTAMGNGVPVIGSFSPLFDDTPIIRCSKDDDFFQEIEKVLNDFDYRSSKIQEQFEFCKKNSWEYSANCYLDIFKNFKKIDISGTYSN